MPRDVLCYAAMTTLLLSACTPGGEGGSSEQSIRGERIAAHVRFLASDALEGRGPASRGETLATEYIATQFALAGVEPAGDGGTYFQTVPLATVEPLPATALRWEGGGNTIEMRFLEDYVALDHHQREESEIDAEAVFVGHGIAAPEFDWDDYKDFDMRGKVAVLFTNEPASDDPKFFGGRALTYYGRWTFKYEEPLRRGAAGVIIIHTDETAGYPWAVVRNSWGGPNPFPRRNDGEPALTAAGWVTEEMGRRILAGTGRPFEELLAAADSRDFRPIPLGLRLRGRLASQVNQIDTRNVIGIMQGSDAGKRSEAVIYTAHWDHLGIGTAVDGDAIYNGAVDNATGCGILLELARAFGEAAAKPARSIIFAAVSAEEGGLRGSAYYAAHPYIPAGKMAANLNFDGFLPLGRVKDISLLGYERTTLRPVVEETARKFGLTIVPYARPEQGPYYRSDHFSLAKAGIPAFSIRLGVDLADGGTGAGLAAFDDFNAHRYHRPSDEFAPEWDFAGLEEIARFGFVLGRNIANQPELPSWNEGDEFLSERLRSWGR